MFKKIFFLTSMVIIILSNCSSVSANQPWKEQSQWNIYGFHDPEQDVILSDFYGDYDSETIKYKEENLLWYRSARGDKSFDVFLESEVVYLGQTQRGIEFCRLEDLEGLNTNEKPSGTVIMYVPDMQKFSSGMEKYTILNVKYRYFYRPVYAVKGQEPTSVTNRSVSQAETLGLAGISEHFLDEYEITGKVNVPQPPANRIMQGFRRVGSILGAVVRGTDRAIGRLLGIDNVIPDGDIILNGFTYQKVGLGEIAKYSLSYTGPDLLLTSRVRFIADRGDDTWAFREADGNLVQTMKYTGHIPSNMKDIRIYYRLQEGGFFEVQEWRQATIFNNQW